MGCSVSRSHTLLAGGQIEEKPSNSSSWYPDSISTPVSRTMSLPTPLVHHPPLCEGDTDHLVSLTSTTYGSLILVDAIRNSQSNPILTGQDRFNRPSSPTQTLDPKEKSSSPDSVINTWELMEGLYDDFGFDFVQKPSSSSSYHCPVDSLEIPNSQLSMSCGEHFVKLADSFEIVELPDSKPLWKHLSEESLLAKLDPNVVSSYRRALHLKQFGRFLQDTKNKSVNDEVCNPSSTSSVDSSLSRSEIYLVGSEDRIVVYHTSLRGIRRTYEDCCVVRMIFKGFGVSVDERDISMDSSYKKEMESVLGGKAVSLPQVLMGGKYIGGADKIKQLHECGELAKLLEGFGVCNAHGGYICESCGDVRFLPCPTCNGSRKIFEEVEGKWRRCPDCNENGLIHCPVCCHS